MRVVILVESNTAVQGVPRGAIRRRESGLERGRGGETEAGSVGDNLSAQPGMMLCVASAWPLLASSSALIAATNDAGAGAEKRGLADHAESSFTSVSTVGGG